MNIVTDVHYLNLIGEPFLYRIKLTGLVAFYGHDRIRQVLVSEAAKGGPNIVSIAMSLRWRHSRNRQREHEAA
jgi:hypothetical protein